MDALSQRYHQRPSTILGIADELAAYQFDVAVMTLAENSEHEGLERERSERYGNRERGGGRRSGAGRRSASVPTPTKVSRTAPQELWERLTRTGSISE